MSRILRHVGRDDFKKTRQRQIGEQKERAAQKLKEWQEAEAERKQIEEAARPHKSNWRRENLREFGEWAPIETSGPANSTSTTFGYFAGGSPVINGETGQQITFTYSGLQGVENYPTTVTIDQGGGDVFQTAPPPFSQIGVQGYTAKLNPRYAEAQKKYQEEMKEWERKKEQQQKDIEATLKSFGTSFKDVQQRGGGITKVGNSYVAIMPGNTTKYDFGSNLMNNIRIVRLVPYDISKPMELTRNVKDAGGTKKWNVSNSQISDDIYLGIGEPPKPPMESEYLMPRRTDYRDVNPLLDASQEFAQQVDADEFMNARVQDAPEQPTFDSNIITDPNNPEYNKRFAPITAIDELSIAALDVAWGQITQLYPDLSWTQKLAIDYAKGNLRPRNVSPSRMYNSGVLKAIEHNLGIQSEPGAVSSYRGMNYLDIAQSATTRLSMGRFNYKATADGVQVTDFFDFDQNKNLGPFGIVPGLNQTAERIIDLGQRRAAEKGYKMVHVMTNRQTGKKVEININPGDGYSPDSYGIPIKFTIPWNQVSPQLQNKLDPTATIIPTVKRRKRNRRGRVVESTWDRVQKRRKTA